MWCTCTRSRLTPARMGHRTHLPSPRPPMSLPRRIRSARSACGSVPDRGSTSLVSLETVGTAVHSTFEPATDDVRGQSRPSSACVSRSSLLRSQLASPSFQALVARQRSLSWLPAATRRAEGPPVASARPNVGRAVIIRTDWPSGSKEFERMRASMFVGVLLGSVLMLPGMADAQPAGTASPPGLRPGCRWLMPCGWRSSATTNCARSG